MEEILGVTDNTRTLRQLTGQGMRELGEDATEADASSSTQDSLRDRYQRLFWEPVVEGQVSFFALRRSLDTQLCRNLLSSGNWSALVCRIVAERGR